MRHLKKKTQQPKRFSSLLASVGLMLSKSSLHSLEDSKRKKTKQRNLQKRGFFKPAQFRAEIPLASPDICDTIVADLSARAFSRHATRTRNRGCQARVS
jgi:hypothetical protein